MKRTDDKSNCCGAAIVRHKGFAGSKLINEWITCGSCGKPCEVVSTPADKEPQNRTCKCGHPEFQHFLAIDSTCAHCACQKFEPVSEPSALPDRITFKTLYFSKEEYEASANTQLATILEKKEAEISRLKSLLLTTNDTANLHGIEYIPALIADKIQAQNKEAQK